MPVTVIPRLPTLSSVLSGAGALFVGTENPDIGVEETCIPVFWLELIMREINFSHAL